MPSSDVDVLVVGFGPHGLALALRLLTEYPERRDALMIVDPLEPLAVWRRGFERLGISALNSDGGKHPFPWPFELEKYAERTGRTAELDTESFMQRPSVSLFNDFCEHLIEHFGLRERHLRTRAEALQLQKDGTVAVTLGDGATIIARHVVLATNPAEPRIPDWYRDAVQVEPALVDEGMLRHSADVNLSTLKDALPGMRLLVVGGGPTAVPLALNAARGGARVDLVPRRPIRENDYFFPVDLAQLNGGAWDGRFDATMTEDDVQRLLHQASTLFQPQVTLRQGRELLTAVAGWDDLIEAAGGSLRCVLANRLEVSLVEGHLYVERHEPGGWRPETGAFDRLWLAAGVTPALDPLIKPFIETGQVPTMLGQPVLDGDYSAGRLPIHVMGSMAQSVAGFGSGSVGAGRAAAAAIVEAIAATCGYGPPRSVMRDGVLNLPGYVRERGAAPAGCIAPSPHRPKGARPRYLGL